MISNIYFITKPKINRLEGKAKAELQSKKIEITDDVRQFYKTIKSAMKRKKSSDLSDDSLEMLDKKVYNSMVETVTNLNNQYYAKAFKLPGKQILYTVYANLISGYLVKKGFSPISLSDMLNNSYKFGSLLEKIPSRYKQKLGIKTKVSGKESPQQERGYFENELK